MRAPVRHRVASAVVRERFGLQRVETKRSRSIILGADPRSLSTTLLFPVSPMAYHIIGNIGDNEQLSPKSIRRIIIIQFQFGGAAAQQYQPPSSEKRRSPTTLFFRCTTEVVDAVPCYVVHTRRKSHALPAASTTPTNLERTLGPPEAMPGSM